MLIGHVAVADHVHDYDHVKVNVNDHVDVDGDGDVADLFISPRLPHAHGS